MKRITQNIWKKSLLCYLCVELFTYHTYRFTKCFNLPPFFSHLCVQCIDFWPCLYQHFIRGINLNRVSVPNVIWIKNHKFIHFHQHFDKYSKNVLIVDYSPFTYFIELEIPLFSITQINLCKLYIIREWVEIWLIWKCYWYYSHLVLFYYYFWITFLIQN